MKRYAAIFGAVVLWCCGYCPSVVHTQTLEETTTDFLGYYLRSGHTAAYQTIVTQNGGKVVNLQADSSFFVLWVPQNYSTLKDKRVLVSVHGTAGTGYVATRDELANAQANNYALVGIQWVLFDAQNRETYFPEDKVYKVIDAALKHMKSKYGAEVNKSAYRGFSRGGLISYEVMQIDRTKGTNYFALTLSLSGGQSSSLTPGKFDRTVFMDKLERGQYGANPFLGASFFLYCGLKDETWGTLQGDYMRYTDSTMRKYGANVSRLLIDPDGKHEGYQTNAGAQASGISFFLALTTTPIPPVLAQPADKATNLPTQATVLQWSTTASAAVFDVQVASDAAFTRTVLRDSLLGGSITSRTLTNLTAGSTYYWRIRSKNNIGSSAWSDARSFTTQAMTGIMEIGEPLSLFISPNPVSEQMVVKFSLARTERVRLTLCDILGRETMQILDAELGAGKHIALVNTANLSQGSYFLRLYAPSLFQTKSVQVIR